MQALGSRTRTRCRAGSSSAWARSSTRTAGGSSAGTRSWRAASRRTRRSCRGAASTARSRPPRPGTTRCSSPAPTSISITGRAPGDPPPGRGSTLSLETCIASSRCRRASPREQRKHVLGVQANLWTRMHTHRAARRMHGLPARRGAGRAGWSPPKRIDWQDFQRRLEPQLARRSLSEAMGSPGARDSAPLRSRAPAAGD